MSPPPDNEETGGTNPMPMLPNDPNAQPPRPLSPVGFLDILRDSRVLALLLTALFGGPAVTGTGHRWRFVPPMGCFNCAAPCSPL